MEEPQVEKTEGVEKYPSGVDRTSNISDDEFYVDPAKEVKLLAKLDLAFTPIIMCKQPHYKVEYTANSISVVYLSCFLDRSNIGWRPSLRNYDYNL